MCKSLLYAVKSKKLCVFTWLEKCMIFIDIFQAFPCGTQEHYKWWPSRDSICGGCCTQQQITLLQQTHGVFWSTIGKSSLLSQPWMHHNHSFWAKNLPSANHLKTPKTKHSSNIKLITCFDQQIGDKFNIIKYNFKSIYSLHGFNPKKLHFGMKAFRKPWLFFVVDTGMESWWPCDVVGIPNLKFSWMSM